MDLYIIVTLLALAVAIVFGTLAWAAKHIKHDKKRTQLYVFIAVLSAVVFMVLMYPILPD